MWRLIHVPRVPLLGQQRAGVVHLRPGEQASAATLHSLPHSPVAAPITGMIIALRIRVKTKKVVGSCTPFPASASLAVGWPPSPGQRSLRQCATPQPSTCASSSHALSMFNPRPPTACQPERCHSLGIGFEQHSCQECRRRMPTCRQTSGPIHDCELCRRCAPSRQVHE